MKWFALAFMLVIAIAGPVQAQDIRDTVRLPDLVATGTRLPLGDGGVVTSQTVVDSAELSARSLRYVADVLRDIPGASITSFGPVGSQTSLFLRGGNSDYVKVLLDGVPLNQPGGTFDFANLTTDNIQRVEVLRGPASVLYGADAMTGVVQLFTRRGAGRVTGHVRGLGGSQGSAQFDAGASGGTGVLSWSAEAGRVSSSGIHDFNNRYHNWVGGGRLGWTPSAATSLGFTARYENGKYEFPTDFAGVPVDSNQFNTNEMLTLGIDGTQRLARNVDLRVLGSWNAITVGFENEPDSPGDTTGFGFASTSNSDLARRGLDARLVMRPWEPVILTAGAAYEFEKEQNESVTWSDFGGGALPDSSAFDASRNTKTGYVQAQAQLQRGVALNAGVRFDDNSAFGNFTTWRAGAAWEMTTGLRLHGSVGTAYKAPKFRELFINVPFEVGNPDLRPEESTTWEVGLEQRFGQDGAIGATWFDSRFTNLIQYDASAPEGSPSYYNLAAAKARGIEVEGRLTAVRWLLVSAQYTHLMTDVTDAGASTSVSFEEGQPLLRRPANSGRVRVAVDPIEGLRLGSNVNLIGPRDDVDFNAFPAVRVVLPGYTLVEFTAEYDVLRSADGRSNLTLLGRIENAFDAQYQAVFGYPGRGRTILAGARVGF